MNVVLILLLIFTSYKWFNSYLISAGYIIYMLQKGIEPPEKSELIECSAFYVRGWVSKFFGK